MLAVHRSNIDRQPDAAYTTTWQACQRHANLDPLSPGGLAFGVWLGLLAILIFIAGVVMSFLAAGGTKALQGRPRSAPSVRPIGLSQNLTGGRDRPDPLA